MVYNPALRTRAHELRKHATKEENTLWYQYLHTLKPQWRRQMVMGGYILDFYCRKLKLAIELDGSQHYTEDGMGYDAERTKYHNALGIEVIRFSNADINQRLRYVCDAIRNTVDARIKTFPFGEGGERSETEEGGRQN